MGLLRNIRELFRSKTSWQTTMMTMSGLAVRVVRRESKPFNGVVLIGMKEGYEFEIFMTDNEARRTAHALLRAADTKSAVPTPEESIQ